MITVRKADDRGRFDFGWPDIRHTSLSLYQDARVYPPPWTPARRSPSTSPPGPGAEPGPRDAPIVRRTLEF